MSTPSEAETAASATAQPATAHDSAAPDPLASADTAALSNEGAQPTESTTATGPIQVVSETVTAANGSTDVLSDSTQPTAPVAVPEPAPSQPDTQQPESQPSTNQVAKVGPEPEAAAQPSLSPPSESEIRTSVHDILRAADLSTITPKQVRQQLETMFPGHTFDDQKKFVNAVIGEYLENPNKFNGKTNGKRAKTDTSEHEHDGGADDGVAMPEDDDQEERDRLMAEELQRELGGRPRRSTAAASAPKPKRKKEKSSGTPARKRPPPPITLSQALMDFLGLDVDSARDITRGEVTKRVWSYIKEHSLQSESNKKKIICDDSLKGLFGQRQTIDMFKMTQALAKHMKSARDVV